MRTIYANYSCLVSFKVEDNVTDEEIKERVIQEYEERNIDFSQFDDGEWSEVYH